MKDISKKRLLITGSLAVCAVLVVLIGKQFITHPPNDEQLSPPSSVINDVKINPEKENEITIKPQEPSSLPSGGNGDSDGTEQTIQPDVSKPDPPKNPANVKNKDDLKNSSKPPEYNPDDTQKSDSNPSEPQGGETKDGKIYVPGFGWIEDNGGGGDGSTIGNEGDELTGNKVGDM